MDNKQAADFFINYLKDVKKRAKKSSLVEVLVGDAQEHGAALFGKIKEMAAENNELHQDKELDRKARSQQAEKIEKQDRIIGLLTENLSLATLFKAKDLTPDEAIFADQMLLKADKILELLK